MYIDTAKSRRGDKTYTRYLLRDSYRDNGKVKHRTLANLSACTPEEIAAIKLALKHKHDLTQLMPLSTLDLKQGPRFGAVWVVKQIADRLGLSKILGTDEQGTIALWQVCARVLKQGSRLSALRLSHSHAAMEVFGLKELKKDDLYENLAWLATQQETMEKRLWTQRCKTNPSSPSLFLYDVTSSYLEGEDNALAAYGYNRDGKKAKKQIVIGLLTDERGDPVAVRVFEGNTVDTKTVAEQIRILSESFGIQEVILVGDRGMLKTPQIDALPEGFRYLTAITKPMMRTLLEENVLQPTLFDEILHEVIHEDVRYIFRRNPVRFQEIQASRQKKLDAINKKAAERTLYLRDHPKASLEVAQRQVQQRIHRLGVQAWVSLESDQEQRVLRVKTDEERLKEDSFLDGCYVIKTNVPSEQASAQTLHARYKDLSKVESAFRTMKTGHLEVRPLYVRKEASTRGHVFVVMLAYRLVRELERYWKELDLTVQEGLNELGAISLTYVTMNQTTCLKIPTPSSRAAELLAQAHVTLPEVLPRTNINVPTNKLSS